MLMKSKKPELPEPDMTPMIDCVFQLITFFMVVINFENMQADERVKLPDSDIAKPPVVKNEDELVINIGFIRNQSGKKVDPEAYVFWPGENLRVADMTNKLKSEKQRYRLIHPTGDIKTTVIIRADGEVPTGLVQEFIKICQENEFTKFSLKAMEKGSE